MKIDEASEVLESSSLAPLFEDLKNPERKEKEGTVFIDLRIKNPFSSEEHASVLLVEYEKRVAFTIRNLTKSKEPNDLARIAHVNHMTNIPKLCWDPEDGEIYIEWTLLIDDNRPLTPEIFELVLAHVLGVFYEERRRFLAAELGKIVEKGLLSKDQAQGLFDQVGKTIETEYMPLIAEILHDE